MRAKNIAINSGLITIPPLKLNPFKTGYSSDIGDPIIKKTKRGNKIIIPKLVVKVGNCRPESSSLFLAHLLTKKAIKKDKIINIVTIKNPSSYIGLGP